MKRTGDIVKIPVYYTDGSTGAPIIEVEKEDSRFKIYPFTLDGKGTGVATFTTSPTSKPSYYVYVEYVGNSLDEIKNFTFKINPEFQTELTISINKVADNTSTKQNGVLFNKDADNNFLLEKLEVDDEAPFGLIQTNPMLTGNVKITVDSNNDLSLNSLNASPELTQQKYKKFKISKDGSYDSDLYKFFDSGKTPKQIVFKVYQESDYLSTFKELSFQYNRFYTAGFKRTDSKLYEEEFSIFAPVWIYNTIPKYFVIFKTKGAVNESTYSGKSFDINEDIIKNSEIVKTIQVRDSNIGKYLAKSINIQGRTNPLKVNFDKNGFTKFCGFNYTTGTYNEASEILTDFYSKEVPIIKFDDYITQGFFRNNIVSSNMFNLEFLFDDDTSNVYEMNRYFGLYCDEIPLAEFSLDQPSQESSSNTPSPRLNQLSLNSDWDFIQNNNSGIELFANKDSILVLTGNSTESIFSSIIEPIESVGNKLHIFIPGDFLARGIANRSVTIDNKNGYSFNAIIENIIYDELNKKTELIIDFAYTNASTIADTLLSFADGGTVNFYEELEAKDYSLKLFDNKFLNNRFIVVKDKLNNFFNVKDFSFSSIRKNLEVHDSVKITLFDKKVNIGNLKGTFEIATQTTADLSSSSRATIDIEITKFLKPGDYFEVFWPNSGASLDGMPNRWRVCVNNTGLLSGQMWPFQSLMSDEKGEFFQFNIDGGDETSELKDISSLIVTAFNKFENRSFECFSTLNKILFRSKEAGEFGNSHSLKIFVDENSVKVCNVVPTLTSERIYSFAGGSSVTNSIASISNDVAKGILDDELFSSLSLKVSLRKRFVDGVSLNYSCSDDEKLFSSVSNIVLDSQNQGFYTTFDSKITSYKIYKPTLNILSLYELKGLDTSIETSDYSRNYFDEIKFNTAHLDNYIIINPNAEIGKPGPSNPEVIQEFRVKIAESNFKNSELLYAYDGEYIYELYRDVNGIVIGFDTGTQSITQFPRFVPVGPFLENSKNFKYVVCPNPLILLNNPVINDIVKDNARQVLPPPHTKFPEQIDHIYLDQPNQQSFVDVDNFKGFSSLTDILTSEEHDLFVNLSKEGDPSRYAINVIDSEYDRLAEDKFSKFALTSKIVPYISKWISKGKDVRDNNYRFNLSRSFGLYGFAPVDADDYSPSSFSNEFPFISNLPYIPVNEKSNLSSYIFDNIERYDFTSSDFDFFSEYFNSGFPLDKIKSLGTSNYVSTELVNNDRKYSTFEYNDTKSRSEVFFRGSLLYSSDRALDGYKFSVVYNQMHEYKGNDIEYETIINRKFKFIVIKINLYMHTNSLGGLSYIDLYCMKTEASKITSEQNGRRQVFFTRASKKDKNSKDLIINVSGVACSLQDSIVTPNETTNLLFLNGTSASGGGSLTGETWNNSRDTDLLKSAKFNNFLQTFKIGKSGTEILENGSINLGYEFSLDYESPKKILRNDMLYPTSDEAKPKEYLKSPVVDIKYNDLQTNDYLFRYDGEFSPKFNNILSFSIIEDSEFEFYTGKRFFRKNTKFTNKFILEEYFNKISEQEILKIGKGSGFYSVYPAVDEVSIDKVSSNVFSSTWDSKFYRKYTTVSDFSEINGIQNLKESPNLFGGKSFKLPNTYNLYEYKADEIKVVEADSSVTITIDILSRIKREILNDQRFINEFEKYANLIKIPLNEFMLSYFTLNIIPLLFVNDVSVYLKQTPLLINPTIEYLNDLTFDESGLVLENYSLKKDVKITYNSNLNISFTIQKDSRYFTSIGFGLELLVV